jgi:predicted nuclease with TOPRIM domain
MWKRFLTTLLVLGFSLSLLGTGCRRYASKELMDQLEEARLAAEAAEVRVAELEAELSRLEEEKAAKEARVEELKAEIQELEARQPKR